MEIREGALRGVLFLPPEPGPAVITIYGGVNNGRVPEVRAAMLASRGYVTLALAYFGVEDLPLIYSSQGLDLEYFEAALDYVLSLPEVFPKKVGLYGMSHGGSLTLSMITEFGSKISACAVSSGAFVIGSSPIKYRGKTIVEATKFRCDVEENCYDPLKYHGGLETVIMNPRQQIAVHTSDTPLLMMIGEEDGDTPGIARFMVDKLRMLGKENVSLEMYPGTGHLIDLPHSPLCRWSRHPYLPHNIKVDYGGQSQQHSLAQFQAWRSLLSFYNAHLKQ